MGESLHTDGGDVGIAGQDECQEAVCGDEGRSGSVSPVAGSWLHRRRRADVLAVQTSTHTVDSGAVQKGADFVKAFALGFDVNVSTVQLSHLSQ